MMPRLPDSKWLPRLVLRFLGFFEFKSFVCSRLLAFDSAFAGNSDKQAQAFFDGTNLTGFQVELTDAEVLELAQSPRSYVPGRVRFGESNWQRVGVRLKGTGTFQPIYAHPSLTLKFNWKPPGLIPKASG